MVFMAICIGLSQGCQPIWGFNYGAKNYGRVCQTYKRAFQVAFTVGILFFLCFQFLPRQIISIFGTGSEVYYQFAERYFKIYMFMTFANGLHPMNSSFFTSIGKAKLGAVVSLTRQILFLLPLILIFPLLMGIDGVMYAGPIADGAAVILSLGFAYREIKKMKQAMKEIPESQC
jgi:Na+-driven multidrug efflux pump